MTRVRWVCALLASLLLTPGRAEGEPVKLRVTLQVSLSDPFLGKNLVQFKEEVERRSGKTIIVDIFDKGQLYRDDQVVNAVSSGAIEMGVAGLSQFSYKAPAVDVMYQPFLFNFDALVRAAVSPDSEIRKLIDKAVLGAAGVRVLWWQSFGSTVFISKGRDVTDPVRIKDRKIRVFGKIMAEFTKRCGGTPVVLSSAKMHDALKDGTVDMVMTGVGTVDTRQLWKVADTITRTEHAALEFLVVMNEATWQSLAEGHRTIVLEAARKAEHDLREQMSTSEANAYTFARNKGMSVHELTPDQVAEWRACSADVLDAYMSNAGDMVRHLMAAYGKLRTQPCCPYRRFLQPALRWGVGTLRVGRPDLTWLPTLWAHSHVG